MGKGLVPGTDTMPFGGGRDLLTGQSAVLSPNFHGFYIR
jgi:hypothetical protein